MLLAAVQEIPSYWLEEANCHEVKAMLENPTCQGIMGNLFVQKHSPGRNWNLSHVNIGNELCQQSEAVQSKCFHSWSSDETSVPAYMWIIASWDLAKLCPDF